MTYDVFSGTLNPAQSQSFPGQPASAGCRSLSSYPCSAREALGYYGMLLGAGCPSCHPTNSIKALNETKQHRLQAGKNHPQASSFPCPTPDIRAEDSLLDIYTSCLTTVPLANYSIS